jgi:hypothetical protein
VHSAGAIPESPDQPHQAVRDAPSQQHAGTGPNTLQLKSKHDEHAAEANDKADADTAASKEAADAKLKGEIAKSPTGMCLTSVVYRGGGNFTWGDSPEQSGVCSGVQTSLGLCDVSPPRECLLARIPWQSHYSLVECCFRCCVDFWQKSLGLESIYNYWFASER